MAAGAGMFPPATCGNHRQSLPAETSASAGNFTCGTVYRRPSHVNFHAPVLQCRLRSIFNQRNSLKTLFTAVNFKYGAGKSAFGGPRLMLPQVKLPAPTGRISLMIYLPAVSAGQLRMFTCSLLGKYSTHLSKKLLKRSQGHLGTINTDFKCQIKNSIPCTCF